MVGLITTAMATSFKEELFMGGHCFQPTVYPTATGVSGATSLTAVSAIANISVGCSVTGTGIAANAVVTAIPSATSLTLSAPHTAAVTAITVSGDVFMMALITPSMAGTYNSATQNYSYMTGQGDEVIGTGYGAAGLALAPVAPNAVGTVAFVSFADPSWTSATFSTAGCMIYNSSARVSNNGAITGRTCSVHDFGGSQQVNAGTFSVLMPAADSMSAILRIL